MISISDDLSRAVIQMYGERGKAWLQALKERITSIKQRWKFDILAPFRSSYNYVTPVLFPDEADAVLKVRISKTAFENEINILKFFPA